MMRVTRIGNHVRVDTIDTGRWLDGDERPRRAYVTYYFGAEIYDSVLSDGRLETESYWSRLRLSNFVVVDGELIKNRFQIEDLIDAYAREGAKDENTCKT